MKNEIVSVFIITDRRTGKMEQVTVNGDGQKPIAFLRKEYPRYTKFVLDGFEINGNFIPLDLRTYNRA